LSFCNMRFRGLVPLLIGLLFAMEGVGAPRAALWPYWSQSAELAAESIDHQPWQAFLSAHVHTDNTGLNRVSYGSVSSTNRADLGNYIQRLSDVRITSYSRDEQLAFWINLYNALTVKVILDHYPIQSIKEIDISPGLFSSGPWGKKLITIESHDLSLDDIEHRILRPIWKDPRIHYAVNCASIGCPNLADTAFSSVSLESELNRAARNYINHPRGVTVVKNHARVSSIYKWFENDFGGSEMAVLEHVRSFASDELKRKLENVSGISGYAYDWALNHSPR
jgi:hypothetical protein